MKLNLGSGRLGAQSFWSNKEEWVNLDFAAFEEDKGDWTQANYLKWDMSKIPWPIVGGEIDCIFASHVFEHFEYQRLMGLVRECYRVLKDGAPIRILCPDPKKFILNWQLKNSRFLLDCFGKDNYAKFQYEEKPGIGFSDMFFPDHYDHQVCLSSDVLMIMLIRAGFSKVYETGFTNTAFPQFFGVASDDEGVNRSMDNRPVLSYYVEAVK